jgi:hypothetical protein
LLATEKSVEFSNITKTYRIAITRENQSSSRIAAIVNAATLQDVTQNESFNQNEQVERSIKKEKSKKHNHSINRKKNDKCVYDEEHFFKKCSYIVKFDRKKK